MLHGSSITSVGFDAPDFDIILDAIVEGLRSSGDSTERERKSEIHYTTPGDEKEQKGRNIGNCHTHIPISLSPYLSQSSPDAHERSGDVTLDPGCLIGSCFFDRKKNDMAAL
jgi:hypothetical protein